MDFSTLLFMSIQGYYVSTQNEYTHMHASEQMDQSLEQLTGTLTANSFSDPMVRRVDSIENSIIMLGNSNLTID